MFGVPGGALGESSTLGRDSSQRSPLSSSQPARLPSSSRGASQVTRSGSSSRWTTSESTTASSTIAASSLRAPQRPYATGSPSSTANPGSTSYSSRRPKRLKCRSGEHNFERKYGVSVPILGPLLLYSSPCFSDATMSAAHSLLLRTSRQVVLFAQLCESSYPR